MEMNWITGKIESLASVRELSILNLCMVRFVQEQDTTKLIGSSFVSITILNLYSIIRRTKKAKYQLLTMCRILHYL